MGGGKSLLKLFRYGLSVPITAAEQRHREFCRKIGEFMMAFSQLEHTIRFILAGALKLPERYSFVVTRNFEFANSCGVVAAVLGDQKPEKRQEIRELYERCKRLGTHRNALAHSLLTHDIEEQRFMGVNQPKQNVEIREIFAMTSLNVLQKKLTLL
ncbi:MAG TPA: hypothetical protein VHZ55_02660 [Bryobacteraceae bacterium]|nr:hypothetical protein [Bryobacteraceae bacterium]